MHIPYVCIWHNQKIPCVRCEQQQRAWQENRDHCKAQLRLCRTRTASGPLPTVATPSQTTQRRELGRASFKHKQTRIRITKVHASCRGWRNEAASEHLSRSGRHTNSYLAVKWNPAQGITQWIKRSNIVQWAPGDLISSPSDSYKLLHVLSHPAGLFVPENNDSLEFWACLYLNSMHFLKFWFFQKWLPRPNQYVRHTFSYVYTLHETRPSRPAVRPRPGRPFRAHVKYICFIWARNIYTFIHTWAHVYIDAYMCKYLLWYM